MLPGTFEDILAAPAMVLNLDSARDRMTILTDRLTAAGFTNIQRVPAIDGATEDMRSLWRPYFTRSPRYMFDSDGQSACGLSHFLIWKNMIENNTPFVTVLEDDIQFHKDWDTLASQYYSLTPKNVDVVYMGNQGSGTPTDPPITTRPIFCTHAYIITQRGAQRLVHTFINAPRLYAIDCMLIDFMSLKAPPYEWVCWNGTMHPDPARHTPHETRNNGLVYQDISFESNIHNQNVNISDKKDYLDIPPQEQRPSQPTWKRTVARYLR